MSPTRRKKLRARLLAWYDRASRDLPWRAPQGGVEAPEPYRVWLSEIMLQQTTVAAVGPYYAAFLQRFPTVQALAAAPREEVLSAWAGLGYYSRARNLHAAAQLLAKVFPTDEAGWRALPGVGPYTAAAIAAIAYGQPTNVVDGNVERVMSRLFAVEEPLPGAKPALRDLAATLVAPDRPGDWAQALMDLGATVCTPTSPKCDLCPWADECAARLSGDPGAYPRKTPKPERPRRYGVAFRIEKGDRLWLVRRPDKGLLGGMLALPTTPWRDERWAKEQALEHAPLKADWSNVGSVRHVFTHFALTLDVLGARGTPDGEGEWGGVDALPTVFKKAALPKPPPARAPRSRRA